MKRSAPELRIFNYLTKIVLAVSAAATDVITGTAHGLTVGDCVQFTTDGTLPAGLDLLTNYYVVEVLSANTFKVSAIPGGTSVNITDTGTGNHAYNLKGKSIECEDHKHLVISVNTANSASLTYKFQGSIQSDVDFNAAQAPTNRWDYVRTVDLNSGTYVAGDTGYTLAGTDDNRLFEVNTNGLKNICVAITAFTAGTMEVRVKRFANDNI